MLTRSFKFAQALLWMFVVVARPALADERLLWFDAGRLKAEAIQAISILASARDEGLEPGDYDATLMAERVRQALDGQVLGPSGQAQLDSALTTALQRYLADRQSGRVDPRQIHAQFDVTRRAPADTLSFLHEAVTAHRLIDAVRDAEPRLPMYAALRQALFQYRALADHPAWQVAMPLLPGRKVVGGQPYTGLPLLARRLEALGDLPAGSTVPDRLEGALAQALRSFQERHGLAADGVLGPSTFQQLAVTPAGRARQIELGMERLRWTPLLQGPRMIVVNVPEFVLRAYEVRDTQVHVKLTMKVIVGKALDTRTPLFDEAMRFIEFSPYWNVPPSIARNELVPRLRRDPAHFQTEGFEFVTASGEVVPTLAAAHLDAVLAGSWRIRQRPGPQNALGDIKFVFPNADNIYLHHTPAPQLFQRERRDFSHGCIRVEAPVALARFVLQDEPQWTEERIREAMEGGVSSTLKLKQPIPVLIAYSTVIAKRGRIFFYPDLYGHDRLLDRALRQRLIGSSPSHLRPHAPTRMASFQ